MNLTKENLTESDIVEEGLRYDLTVPLARFYANNREKLPNPFKAIQIDYSFRAERPQRGRLRQFTQCDIDVFGDSSINAEVDLLKTAIDTYNSLGFKNIIVKVNDRRILNALILNAGFSEQEISTVCVTLDKIDKIGINGIMMELMEKGLNTASINKLVEEINNVVENGFEIVTNYGVDATVVQDMKYLIETISKLIKTESKIVFDISIVRGQGYYTGTVFEFYGDGLNSALGGGGRYDTMVKKMVGIDVPAVGASIGFERISLLLLEQNAKFEQKENLALIYDEDDNIVEVFKVKEELMKKYNVSLFKRPKNMKSFFEKVQEVADLVTSVKDHKENKEIKVLQ